ncbi:ATP-binding cassette domain-containing protein [Metabacillus fastidiosus]|uniref:ATP-binding cassette domain-containing protein n=1 Tax=Metabacillus fastidiosus TaxID=1458 RepID=UPI003D2B3205
MLNISKKIDRKLVLENLSFTCTRPSATAVCGTNGSGKSTFLKMLAGIYEPTKGLVKRGTKKVGYVPEHFPENVRFKLKEYLLLTASFQAGSKKEIEAELLEYTSLFGIEPFLHTPLKQCSKGTKQKAGLIQALLMKPEILLLDEPLTGLDTASQQKLIQLLEKLKKEICIIFTTHENIMIEKLADHILYVESGEVICPKESTKESAKESTKEERLIKVKFNNKETFKQVDAFHIEYEGDTALLTVDKDRSDQILIDLLHKECSVLEVREKRRQ